jgi:nickel-type superoxide dismutase maturation protease
MQVSGPSMAPLLRPGDHVLVDLGAFRCSEPVPGDVVLAHHPQEPGRRVIKRVIAVSAAGVDLRGDNPDLSTDSRDYGLVPINLVLGRIVSRFP